MHCNKAYLQSWNVFLPKLQQLNGQIIAFSSQDAPAIKATIAKWKLNFPLFSDFRSTIANVHGVYVDKTLRKDYTRSGGAMIQAGLLLHKECTN